MNLPYSQTDSICRAELISTPTLLAPHCSYTFFLVINGRMELKTDSQQFQLNLGDIYFLSHAASCQIQLHKQSSLLLVSFTPEFISPYMPGFPFEVIVNSVLFPDKKYNRLIHSLIELSCHFFSDAPNRHLIMISAHKLLYELESNFCILNHASVADSYRYRDRIRTITDFVNDNYRQNITQSDMAQHLYLSPQHCSRFFRQYFEMTFLEYLNYTRLQHALDQLQYSALSITQIAFQNGFPNLTSFNRVFQKHMHTTPNEYRKRYLESQSEPRKDTEIQDHSASLERLNHYIQQLPPEALSEEAPNAEQLTLHSADSNISFPSWDSILNIGVLSNCLMHKFHMQLADIQKWLHFKYVRFHGILDDTIIPLIPDTEKYNYQNIDTIFDHLKELGLVPFIEITHIPYGGNLEKLRPLLKHCLHRYGMSEMEYWHFEICMETTQYLEAEITDTVLSQYMSFYATCLNIVKALIPKAKIGGPAFHAAAPFSIFDQFLQKISDENLEIDFISACLYPYTLPQNAGKNNEQQAVILGSDQTISKRATRLSSILQRSALRNKQFFITEYNFSISPRNHMNDSCFQATFLLKTLLDNSEFFSGFGYFRCLDISVVHSDVTTPLYGGPGLITKDNIRKPSYYAYYFLSLMQGKLLMKGDGFLFTRTSKDCYALLLYYYLHPNSELLLLPRDPSLLSDSQTPFPDAEVKRYQIEIKGMLGTSYLVKQHTLNQEHGSVLDKWIELNTASYLFPTDIHYLKNISIPHRAMNVIHTLDNCLQFSVCLMPHEIKYIEIMPVPSI